MSTHNEFSERMIQSCLFEIYELEARMKLDTIHLNELKEKISFYEKNLEHSSDNTEVDEYDLEAGINLSSPGVIKPEYSNFYSK